MKYSRTVYTGRLQNLTTGVYANSILRSEIFVHSLNKCEHQFLVFLVGLQQRTYSVPALVVVVSKDTNKYVMSRSAKHNENNEVGKGDYRVQRVERLGYRVHCMGRKGLFVGTLEERECLSHAASQEKNIHYKVETLSMLGIQEARWPVARREGWRGVVPSPEREAGLATPQELLSRLCEALGFVNNDWNYDFAICLIYGNCNNDFIKCGSIKFLAHPALKSHTPHAPALLPLLGTTLPSFLPYLDILWGSVKYYCVFSKKPP